jgi:hypothetical protein
MWVSENHGHITQGTIVDGVDWGRGDCNPLSIVMSNSCDLEHGKSNFLIVAALESASDTLQQTVEFKSLVENANENFELTKKQWNAFRNFLLNYIHNKNICRHFFFDPRPVIDMDCLVVDFQQVKSIEMDKIQFLSIEGQMNHPFVEQMMMRFTCYTSRIPVDRVNSELENIYIQELANGYKPKE